MPTMDPARLVRLLGALEPVTTPAVTERGNRAVSEFSEYLAI